LSENSKYTVFPRLERAHYINFTGGSLVVFGKQIKLYYLFDTREYHEFVGLVFTRVSANQTNNIHRYPMDNKYIMYCTIL